jgi:DedD protein
MDESALRDVERWKDKIEVRLDNRQVFFLFFGSALCACMLFVLGVIVGKRLESRGRAAVPEVQDPLAVLDRINTPGLAGAGSATAGQRVDQALTFPKALIGAPAKGRVGSLSAATAPTAATTAPKVSAIATAKVQAPAAKVQAPAAAASKSVVSVAPKLAAAPAVAAVSAANKGKFALQLSSFPERSEADALAKRFAAQGAYVIVSELPGKATMYRVRVGSYGSTQEAVAAKGTFEKANNVIAYIAGR